MVIILSKTLEKKKGVNDVRSKSIERRLSELRTMSKGTTLFSCGSVEADRWLDLGRSCAIQQRAPCQAGASLESLWDVMPEPGSLHWAKEPGSATAITSLIRDLSLANGSLVSPHAHTTSTTAHYTTTATSQAPVAPPSKRQCRSLSFSDEYSGFRSSWRPQGSRVWTAVEKRRCHSGGSVRGGGGFSGGHFPTIQRSSSFSLPSCSSIPSDGGLDLPFFNQRLPLHPQFTASPVSPISPSYHHQSHHHHFLRPLSLSHEQISLPELQREEASEASSPDSTPELGRRAGQRAGGTGCLSRSRSQPCVLNDKKIGMKRRRPEDAQEQRPSLDLAKMTQKLQTFQSLSCSGFSAADGRQSNLQLPSTVTSSQPDSDFITVSEPGLESPQEVAGDDEEEEDSSYEELDSDSACSVDSRPGSPDGVVADKRTLWKGDRMTQRDIFQLGGELDLDQIERN
ncbi:protein FAM53B-like [Paralichthys olivaceus]|uniref:protein FAM53B-like n=1 Tax=Paralichthys olivaceus TaxID=8255 RepID=UPI00097E1195|nr:PREDICTED: protein FAM53B-like [Paralichthys olivaceus]